MNEKDKQAILELYSSEFSCHQCKCTLNIPTCKGCPIYSQSFNPD